MRIGIIDFYGYAGLDLEAIRAAVPVHEGGQVSVDQVPQLVEKLKGATGAADVSTVCCDSQGGLIIFLGLAGKSARNLPYNPAPSGTARFPGAVVDLYQQFTDAVMKAVERGAAAEDDSRGYALFADPAARAKQLAMREYAIRHERLIRQVLESASDAGQRAIAAQLLGYARQSRKQIAALVHASQDPDDEVRNNATRALGALARSNPKTAGRIPAAGFIEMLSSRSWTDRNKASALLEALTRSRDPELLRNLRAHALDPLVEMAGWRSAGHAYAAKVILGRCEGIEETRLQKLVEAGDVAAILQRLRPE